MRSDMISTGPLVRAIEARGGVDALAYEEYSDGKITRGRMSTVTAWYKDRAPKGSANVFAVDAACIELLHQHPCLVYGDDWWDNHLTEPEPIILAQRESEVLEEAVA